jgi:hypothetical protein
VTDFAGSEQPAGWPGSGESERGAQAVVAAASPGDP